MCVCFLFSSGYLTKERERELHICIQRQAQVDFGISDASAGFSTFLQSSSAVDIPYSQRGLSDCGHRTGVFVLIVRKQALQVIEQVFLFSLSIRISSFLSLLLSGSLSPCSTRA